MDLPRVWNQFPPLDLLRSEYPAEDFALERLMAEEYLNIIQACRGVGRRKCVVVDLDGTLWPGVLADTGSPFPTTIGFVPWTLQGLYLGLHEALKALKQRGVLLACVSKNDESVVRKLWRNPDEAPKDSLLTLEDFAAIRINWEEKADNIAQELKLGLDAIVFIDDNATEREKIKHLMPEVVVLGDNPFITRRLLLSRWDLQVPRITDEASRRTELAKVMAARENLRASVPRAEDFLRDLKISCEVTRVMDETDLPRLHELIVRTNQFNTTGLRLSKAELRERIFSPTSRVYGMRAEDRLGKHGLVSVCVTEGAQIDLFVMSCRVIGFGLERAFLGCVLQDLRGRSTDITGVIYELDRNLPARSLFERLGFSPVGEHQWVLPAVAPLPAPFVSVRTKGIAATSESTGQSASGLDART